MKLRSVGRSQAHKTVFGIGETRETDAALLARERAARKTNANEPSRATSVKTAKAFRLQRNVLMAAKRNESTSLIG